MLENQVIYTIDRKDGTEFELDILAGTGLEIIQENMKDDPYFDSSTEQTILYHRPFDKMCKVTQTLLRYPRFKSRATGCEQIEEDFYCYSASYALEDKERILKMLKRVAENTLH